jgi:hypothetical protein
MRTLPHDSSEPKASTDSCAGYDGLARALARLAASWWCAHSASFQGRTTRRDIPGGAAESKGSESLSTRSAITA